MEPKTNAPDQPETPLDPDVREMREAGHRLVDWIADYLENIREHDVLSRVQPGEVTAGLPAQPSMEGRSYDALLEQFRGTLLPGVTHWNHPRFFAYFSITGSQAGLLGEMLASALNVNGMLWRTSPAATELETVVLDWLRGLLGLPEGLFGIINDTASINSFLALAAAREALGLDIRGRGMTGRDLPRMRIYCSDQAHSSIDKAALALGFGSVGIRHIESDDDLVMKVADLKAAIASDRQNGILPCAVVATCGTTSTASVDPIEAIAAVAEREDLWLHVDAAYGGSAMIVEENRTRWKGINRADSIVVNPHKWLFTPIDCSVLYTRRPEVLRETFSLVPEYLKTSDAPEVINYMDYGLQLGRRFRALKLWMVLEHYGTDRLKQRIREHIGYAERLAGEIDAMDDAELLAPQSFSVVVFRRVVRNGSGKIDEVASEKASAALLDTINATGRCYVSHTRLHGRYGIRVAIGNGATVWDDVAVLLDLIRSS